MKRLKTYFDLIRFAERLQRGAFALILFYALLEATLPFVTLYFSANILNSLLAGEEFMTVFLHSVLPLALSSFFILVMRTWYSNYWYQKKIRELGSVTSVAIMKKCITMDYEQKEKQEYDKLLQTAREGITGSGGFPTYYQNFADVLTSVFSLIYAGVLIAPLFAQKGGGEGVYAFLDSPLSACLLFLIEFGIIAAQILISRHRGKLEYRLYLGNVKLNRESNYLLGMALDYTNGKDIRLYSLAKEIKRQFDALSEDCRDLYLPGIRKCSKWESVSYALLQVGVFLAYAFVGAKAIFGLLSVGSILSVVGAITSLNQAIVKCGQAFVSMGIQSNYLMPVVTFVNLPSEKYNGTLPVEKRDDNRYEIEFRDVSFSYPDRKELVLDRVSFRFRLGEKLSIVGRNGAGKTTFIKLLCRLYDPTEGSILLNGIDIKKYDYEEYLSLFSVVFQDFKLFPDTIARNVAVSASPDRERVKDCLERAGFSERLASLEKGMDSELYNKDEKGVEISGGEAQKIAIARALYKDAPFVILDEPTAALDPLSEYEIYSKFDSLVKGKTSVYISHRMSSCKFCDKVLVFDGGRIVECGEHAELLKKSGFYRSLWEAQAKYYT
ncbi:MAG: ABC transporter ATP-binding protein [Clostridia bacterium]|nr:ABC transporter ATP-binding protein [Clostridia bacterium]